MTESNTSSFLLANLMRHARMLVGDRDEAARLVLQALAHQLDGALEMRHERGAWLILEVPAPADAAALAAVEQGLTRQAASSVRCKRRKIGRAW